MIIDVGPSEVLECIREWLLRIGEFDVEKKSAWRKRRLIGKKRLSGGYPVLDGVGDYTLLYIHFEFEASKIAGGTILVGEYYWVNPLSGGRKEQALILPENPRIKCLYCGNMNPNERYYCNTCGHSLRSGSKRWEAHLLVRGRKYVQSLENYFDLKVLKYSTWHDSDVDLSKFKDDQIIALLTFEAKSLREIAGELNIQRIGDIKRLQKKLIKLAQSKPNIVGGLYGVQRSGEGLFWRRDITKNE